MIFRGANVELFIGDVSSEYETFIKSNDIRLMNVDVFLTEAEASTEANSSLSALKKNEPLNREACTCPNDECGRSFDHPVELTVLSSNPAETYLACPYCMSRMDTKTEEEEQRPIRSVSATSRIAAILKKEQDKLDQRGTDEGNCSNGFGYLKKRPKGTPIPDECLVCEKMIQCLQ
jgi:DNA-directed RNA polymerase subunit RPC12/RpoP